MSTEDVSSTNLYTVKIEGIPLHENNIYNMEFPEFTFKHYDDAINYVKAVIKALQLTNNERYTFDISIETKTNFEDVTFSKSNEDNRVF